MGSGSIALQRFFIIEAAVVFVLTALPSIVAAQTPPCPQTTSSGTRQGIVVVSPDGILSCVDNDANAAIGNSWQSWDMHKGTYPHGAFISSYTTASGIYH